MKRGRPAGSKTRKAPTAHVAAPKGWQVAVFWEARLTEEHRDFMRAGGMRMNQPEVECGLAERIFPDGLFLINVGTRRVFRVTDGRLAAWGWAG